jgi:hypothetical protein
MKQNDIEDVKYSLSPHQYENIFEVYEDSDIGYFYNLLKTVNFPMDLDPTIYNIYVVRPGDTWTLIAWTVYNNISLWWSICALNNIQNPLNMPPPGTEIKTLKIVYLQKILSDMRSG